MHWVDIGCDGIPHGNIDNVTYSDVALAVQQEQLLEYTNYPALVERLKSAHNLDAKEVYQCYKERKYMDPPGSFAYRTRISSCRINCVELNESICKS